MSKYLRLQIDVYVENEELAEELLSQDADSLTLQRAIENGEVSIDGYQDVEDHS